MLEPFKGPLLKLKLAEERFHELRGYVLKHQSNASVDFFHTGKQPDGWRFKNKSPVPYEVSLLLGEVTYQLRSSLDLAMCDLARIKNVGLHNMYFPIAENSEKFTQKLENKNKYEPWKKLGSEFIEYIKELKPYRGGNQLLRDLHDLNNQDKHKLVPPADQFISVTQDPAAMMYNEHGLRIISIGGNLVGYREEEAISDTMFFKHPSDSLRVNGTIVTFHPDYIAGNKPLIEYTERMSKEVTSVMTRIQDLAE